MRRENEERIEIKLMKNLAACPNEEQRRTKKKNERASGTSEWDDKKDNIYDVCRNKISLKICFEARFK